MAKNPSFFKILIFDFFTRLRIPPAFTKNFEKNLLEKLPQESLLETCDGRFWHVDVEKIDNNLCFKYGWKQFVRHNSLKLGDLIVFTYHGNFRFKLEIYGRNCCRKKVELFKRRVQRPRICKSMSRNRERPVRKVETLFGERENLKKTSDVQTADNFTSNYPFFKVTMKHSYVYRSYVSLPKRFMRENGVKLTGKNIKLMYSNKTWLAKMYNPPVYARLYAGWNVFVKDNGLKEDDVCLFELIDKDDVSFRVSIFPNIS